MIRCRECDSQVAENDLFCPFCGVKIEAAQPEARFEEPVQAAAPVDEVSSDATTEPDIDDIPTPGILADFGTTHDNVDPGPTSEYSLDSAEAIAIGSVDSAELSVPDPDVVGELSEPPTPERSEPEPPSIFEERSVFGDQSISRPVQDLEDSDPHASRSMFDSVRIMEPKQDDVDTRIQTSSGPISEVPPPSVLSESTNVEPKQYTEPNLATGGDTDGKRSKLKPLTEGTILNGRYEIVRKIGGGGMGAVYLASDNNLGGVLRAVKEMVQSHIEEEQQEKAINDFKRESMILSTLDHPSIPTIYDYFYDADEGRFYLVMKYISGGDLASRLRSAAEGKIDEKSITQWAIQICDVLDYLHNQPSTIVYRDLKPSNIMIDGNSGRIMLIDFGIARSISQKEEKGVTAVGTMGYAPPELFSGNVEQRSDIYSLGSTMFHLLTGADPQSNPLLIFDFQKNPRPRQINSQLSDQIERILMRAVEYNADMRFASAAEMRSVLEDHLASLRTGNVTYGVSAVPASVSLENQSVFCGFCGQRIVATDLFCAFCGSTPRSTLVHRRRRS
jgi:eukaryotic-like serine/threonine-protein kinase